MLFRKSAVLIGVQNEFTILETTCEKDAPIRTINKN